MCVCVFVHATQVKAPKELMKYIVPKGFIAIDGTSLTVCKVNFEECWFTFMLIDYTQKHIVVPGKAVGEKVNLEVDVVKFHPHPPQTTPPA